MADLTGALKGKIGPLPGWAWAGLAAGGIGLVVIARRNSPSSSTGMTGTSTSSGTRGVPGQYDVTAFQGVPGPPGPQGQPGQIGSTGWPGASTYVIGTNSAPGGKAIYAWVSDHWEQMPGGGVKVWTDNTGAPWVLNNQGEIWAWENGQWVHQPGQGALGVGGAAPGVGGPKGSAAVGSRSTSPHLYMHPAIKNVPRYSHFVRSTGGPGRGAQIDSAATQAGVHPARLRMLNGLHRGPIRIS